MIKQKSKVELLKDIQVERQRLEKSLAKLSKEDMIQSELIGEWTVKDILAHLVAWEQLFMSWYDSGLQNTIPEINPVGMSTKAIDALNQQIFDQYRQHSLDDILSRFQDSYQQVLATVQEIPGEVMFSPGWFVWTGRLTLADYIAGNTCNHYRWANVKIRAWQKAHKML